MIRTIFYIIIALIFISETIPVQALAVDINPQTDAAIPNPRYAEAKKEFLILEKELSLKEAELESLNRQVEHSSREIVGVYQELGKAEKALTSHQEILNARIVEVYKNRGNFVILILTSESLSDLWARISILSRINQIDRSLLAENKRQFDKVEYLKKQIADKKNNQLELRKLKIKELAGLRLQYESKKTTLANIPPMLQQKKTFTSQLPPQGLPANQ